jgi:hypothetical protein
LVEGGGDVAFVKHTTVYENADGKRKQWWARNTLSYDFQLLCPDGKFCFSHSNSLLLGLRCLCVSYCSDIFEFMH